MVTPAKVIYNLAKCIIFLELTLNKGREKKKQTPETLHKSECIRCISSCMVMTYLGSSDPQKASLPLRQGMSFEVACRYNIQSL